MTAAVLHAVMDETRKELTVNKKETSMFIRTKISAKDDRQSSQAMGVIGASVLVVVIACIVIPDILTCLNAIYYKRKTRVVVEC